MRNMKEFAILSFSILLLAKLAKLEGGEIQRRTVALDESTKLDCTLSDNKSWWYTPDLGSEIRLTSKQLVLNIVSKQYKIDGSYNGTSFNLIIRNVTLGQEGLYVCKNDNGDKQQWNVRIQKGSTTLGYDRRIGSLSGTTETDHPESEKKTQIIIGVPVGFGVFVVVVVISVLVIVVYRKKRTPNSENNNHAPENLEKHPEKKVASDNDITKVEAKPLLMSNQIEDSVKNASPERADPDKEIASDNDITKVETDPLLMSNQTEDSVKNASSEQADPDKEIASDIDITKVETDPLLMSNQTEDDVKNASPERAE